MTPIPERTQVRIGYFGKPEEALSLRGLEHVLRDANYTVVFVTTGKHDESTRRDGTLQRFARSHGLRLVDYPDTEPLLDDVDLVLSFSNSVVFPASFLDRVRLGVVNMHPAALPAYRGSHGVAHAILNGETEVGVTLHYCAPDIDTGPIIDLRYVPMGPDDTVRSMWLPVDELALRMLADLAPRLADAARRGERVEARPQTEEGARWYSTRSLPDQWELDTSMPPELQRRYVRAFDHPWTRPAYVTTAAGDRLDLAVRDGEIVVASVTRAPGGR